MSSEAAGIVILREPITQAELSRLVKLYFDDMVKYVVDLRRQVIAIGGELHPDAEHILLEDGSQQQDLWGANYMVAEIYLTGSLERERHNALLRCLLGFTPAAFRQVAQLFPASTRS